MVGLASSPCTNSPGSIGQRHRWLSPHAIRSGSTRYGERSMTRRLGMRLGGLSTRGGGREHSVAWRHRRGPRAPREDAARCGG
jgi:hypothetical protein